MLCTRCKKRPAVVFMTRIDDNKTVNEGLCLSCAKDMGIKPVDDLIKQAGLSEDDINNMSDDLMSIMEMDDDDDDLENGEDTPDFVPGGAHTMPPLLKNLQGFFGGNFPVAPQGESGRDGAGSGAGKSGKSEEKSKNKVNKLKFLTNYCEHLTLKAREGKLDNVVGREREIYRAMQILGRRTKNNPCLIGEPGVGKTAIAEGIALKIANGDAPFRLMSKEIYRLDLTALVAGTQFRGQFESRIKGLIEEVRAQKNIILFVDEVHNLVGVGDSEGSMNAANILKPPLSRGEVQMIGATTFNEYRKYIEKDPALERRFQPIIVEEQSVGETVKILKGVKSYYETHHRVKVSDDVLSLIVTLSERFITDRHLPDKAIDLLDESMSCTALRSADLTQYDILNSRLSRLVQEETLLESFSEVDYERVALVKSEIIRLSEEMRVVDRKISGICVTDDDVANVIELWTGIPAAKIMETELRKVARLESVLKSKIIGQDEAVELVAAAVRRSRVRLSPRPRPSSFIFVGPTGVGKTELVKVLASELFDTAQPLIRLDMSEFMEKHSVSRIIGSPPGYVGYDEGGQLTEKVRRKPYSVILLDEIEKAHHDVLNILLQILDEGKVTDSHGRVVSFQNAIIVMTSNAGSERRGGGIGFNKSTSVLEREKAEKALSEFLRPEFISRVDEIVVFEPLTEDGYKKIAALMLEEMRPSLLEKNMELSLDDKVIEYIAKKSFGGKYGARDLRRVIRKEVEDKIAILIADNGANPPQKIEISTDGNGIAAISLL